MSIITTSLPNPEHTDGLIDTLRAPTMRGMSAFYSHHDVPMFNVPEMLGLDSFIRHPFKPKLAKMEDGSDDPVGCSKNQVPFIIDYPSLLDLKDTQVLDGRLMELYHECRKALERKEMGKINMFKLGLDVSLARYLSYLESKKHRFLYPNPRHEFYDTKNKALVNSIAKALEKLRHRQPAPICQTKQLFLFDKDGKATTKDVSICRKLSPSGWYDKLGKILPTATFGGVNLAIERYDNYYLLQRPAQNTQLKQFEHNMQSVYVLWHLHND